MTQFNSAVRRAATLLTVVVFVGLAGEVSAFAAAAGGGAATGGGAAPGAVAQSAHLVAFGMDTAPDSGQSDEDAITDIESELGRKLAVTRVYLRWDSAFPTSYADWLGARGTVPIVSVKAERLNGSSVSWASIADAQPGSTIYTQMVGWADRFRDYSYPVYFTFNHEPESAANQDRGDAADFVAAWRRLHAVFDAEGATNVRWMWTMTSWAFEVSPSDDRYADNWYPGDDDVDAISADAYNWGDCGPGNGWESLATVISGFVAFGAQHPSIPMWMSEFGTVEGTPGQKAQWIAAVQALLQQPAYAQIVGVSYYNELQPGLPCDWPIESSASATAAMRKLAQDPYFQGTAAPSTSGSAPSTPIAYAGSAATSGNASVENVTVPSTVRIGQGLMLIATSGTDRALTAPSGWSPVGTVSSATMYSAVWQRSAHTGDAGSTVAVQFGVTKGLVQLLVYSGTRASAPVLSAAARSVEHATSLLATPALTTTSGLVISYWATRSSVPVTLTAAGVTTRRATAGTGGGRVTALSADSSSGSARTASVNPAVTHGITWTIALA